jgi:hypothetical protein
MFPLTLDDRSTGDLRASAGGTWRVFTDGVMGGLSAAEVDAVDDGRAALCLRGRVRLENNGGFVQMALDLPSPLPADAAGLELDLRGRPLRYGLHLRTTDMPAPWQAWRTALDVTPSWQTLHLPWSAFAPYRFEGRLDPTRIRRIGLLAIGMAGDAELCLGRLAVV